MRARGAATVELALGSMLFVTVLLLGIHLSESVFLSLKVQEAQQFSVWNSTGKRTHLFSEAALSAGTGAIYAPAKQIYATADEEAQERYTDFDGRTGRDGAVGLSQVFTRAAPVQVACEQVQRIGFDIPRGSSQGYASYGDQLRQVRRYYESPPALSCRATSRLQLVGVPKLYLQGGDGFFKQPQVMVEQLHLCGMGRAESGACRGEFGVLTGDWALEGPVSGQHRELNADVPLNARGNTLFNRPYKRMVEALYDAGGGSHGRAASRFAAMVAENTANPNRSPHDEREFFMSYRGADNKYVDGVKIGSRQHRWNTSGVYFSDSTDKKKRKPRPQCFLGLPGCR